MSGRHGRGRLTTEEVLRRVRDDATLAATPPEILAFRKAGGRATVDEQTGHLEITLSGGSDSVEDRSTLLSEMRRLRGIRRLKVGIGGEFADRSVESLEDGSVLVDVDLARTDLSDQGLERLARCHRVERLDVSSTAITDQGLARIALLPNLRHLSLARTSVSAAGIRCLHRVQNLQSLDLSRTDLSDEVSAALQPLRCLEMLALSGTLVTDRAMESLGQLVALRSIGLTGTLVTNHGVATLRKCRPDLNVVWSRSLNLIGYWGEDADAYRVALGDTVRHQSRVVKEDHAFIHPRHLVDPGWHDADRAAVIGYLAGAPVITRCRGLSYCRFGCGWNGSAEQSDGIWLWPAGLAHYVEHHAVRLPDELVSHMRGRNFAVPGKVTESRFETPVSTAFWRQWCRRQIESEGSRS